MIEFNFAVIAAIIRSLLADGLSDKEERNKTAATKNHLPNATKRFKIFIFGNQKPKIFDHNSTSYRGHDIKFFNFLKAKIHNR